MRLLDLPHNIISTITRSLLSKLIALEILDLNDNRLTYIADVSLPALTKLRLKNNEFTAMPSFTNLGNTLMHLWLDGNNISIIQPHDFAGFGKLVTLGLSYTQLQAIPDGRKLTNLKHLTLGNSPIKTTSMHSLALLGNLETLVLKNTELIVIPSVCPKNSLNLRLDDIQTLVLCSRKMAWLKQSFFTVTYTDVMCDDLGKMWSEATFDELLTLQEPPSQPGDVKRKISFTAII